jgi:hypothetical protein
MRFDLTIFADDMNELRDALAQISSTLPANTFANPSRGFSVSVSPSFNQGAPTPTALQPTIPQPILDAADEAAAASTKPTRVRRTKAQIAADNAAAAQRAAANGQDHGDDAGADDDEDDVAPETEAEPVIAVTMTPAQAKLAALEKLREAYVLTGGPVAVKQVQKDFGVAKFVEVPDEKGPELYQRAVALLASLNI